jgi:hypothetical protein
VADSPGEVVQWLDEKVLVHGVKGPVQIHLVGVLDGRHLVDLAEAIVVEGTRHLPEGFPLQTVVRDGAEGFLYPLLQVVQGVLGLDHQAHGLGCVVTIFELVKTLVNLVVSELERWQKVNTKLISKT